MSWNFTNVTFYVTAHQDDALLFRGEQLYSDLHDGPDVKVVYIFTTAGDGGATNGWWQAREQGAIAALIASIATATATDPITFSSSPLVADRVMIGNHSIQRYTYMNAVSYFLRLPDGNIDNSGFPSTNYQTLSKLRDGVIQTITAVDNSTTYNSWTDFSSALKTIMEQEASTSPNPHPWLNASDYSQTLDPGGHPDHYATGDALKTFAAGTYNRVWWLSYSMQWRPDTPPNLVDPYLSNKRCLFYTYGFAAQVRMSLVGVVQPPNDLEWNGVGNKSYCRQLPYDQSDA